MRQLHAPSFREGLVDSLSRGGDTARDVSGSGGASPRPFGGFTCGARALVVLAASRSRTRCRRAHSANMCAMFHSNLSVAMAWLSLGQGSITAYGVPWCEGMLDVVI